MSFNLEIMLRNSERVFADRITHERPVAQWTEADAAQALRKVLHAIATVMDPSSDPERAVNFRGMSWIVSPSHDGGGVVLALEIHSASAVAGPFDVPAAQLDQLIGRAIHADQPTGEVH
jgi:hypothetical protein